MAGCGYHGGGHKTKNLLIIFSGSKTPFDWLYIKPVHHQESNALAFFIDHVICSVQAEGWHSTQKHLSPIDRIDCCPNS